MNIPVIGAASGDHNLVINYTDGTISRQQAKLIGTDGAIISINAYAGFTSSTELPSQVQQQFDLIKRDTYAGYTEYIEFVYTNDSDTNQTGNRILEIWVKEFIGG